MLRKRIFWLGALWALLLASIALFRPVAYAQFCGYLGSSYCQYQAGMYYIDADDPASGLYWIQKAADKEYGPAEREMARLHIQGKVLEQNIEAVKQWYERAATHGDAEGQYYSARFALSLNSFEGNGEARHLLRGAVSQKYIPAYTLLAQIYLKHGEPEEFNEGKQLVATAAQSGDREAQALLGRIHALRWINNANRRDAFFWLSLSNHEYNPDYKENSFLLGELYFEGGDGIEKNYSLAYAWLGNAFPARTDADLLLGLMNKASAGQCPERTKDDLEGAFQHFEKAADNHNNEAMIELANMYFFGISVEKNKEKSKQLMQEVFWQKTVSREFGQPIFPDSYQEGVEDYTIYIMPSFEQDKNVMIKVFSKDGHQYMKTKFLYQKESAPQEISSKKWKELLARLDKINFWEMRYDDKVMGLDGTPILIEGIQKERYHAVERNGSWQEISAVTEYMEELAGVGRHTKPSKEK